MDNYDSIFGKHFMLLLFRHFCVLKILPICYIFIFSTTESVHFVILGCYGNSMMDGL